MNYLLNEIAQQIEELETNNNTLYDKIAKVWGDSTDGSFEMALDYEGYNSNFRKIVDLKRYYIDHALLEGRVTQSLYKLFNDEIDAITDSTDNWKNRSQINIVYRELV